MRKSRTNLYAVLTFAPTALPRLMAFLSLCWPPEDGESTEPDPRFGLADAGARLAEGWPGLEVWGLCCWATEFSNILWSTEEERKERERKKGRGVRAQQDLAEDVKMVLTVWMRQSCRYDTHGVFALEMSCTNSASKGEIPHWILFMGKSPQHGMIKYHATQL